MKKILKLLLAALLLFTLTATLFGCGKAELSLDESAMPQMVYVLGEELDLSSGMLVVKNKKSTENIPLNHEDVTVTGYDKNALGEQTLTVTYGKSSVDFKITVVPRMQVVDFTTDYLVGDKLDLSKGRLRITRNDGSNYTVILKSDKITISELDSEAPGERTLTATYKSGSDTYTATFKVTVHKVDTVSFTAPTKITYKSHEEKIDLTGALLTLKGKGGELSRDIPVTEDMISGFDLSEANGTNTPLDQTVTVTYGENTFTFGIKINYTSVSEFKDNSDLFKDFVWSGKDESELPVISETLGETAIDMIELYLDMSPAEQTLLTRTEVLNTARTAMIYGYQKWGNDINDFEGVFELVDMQFEFVCRDRAAIESAITKLQDRTRPIYVLYDVIQGMIDTFGSEAYDEVLFTFTLEDGEEDDVEMHFSDYPTVDPELFDILIGVFGYMLELDTLMDAVGDDWLTNINEYSDEITAVYNSIINSEYYSNEFAQFFYYVSMWREKDDAFDFLYYYFYDVEENVDAIIKIANIRLPSALEEVFAHVHEAMTQLEYLANYMVSDTTQFFYHYHKACSLSNAILSGTDSEDKMNQVLFYGLPLNSMLGMSADEIYTFDYMISYLATTEGGYYPLCGSLLELPEFDALMDKYLDVIIKRFENEDYDGSADYTADVRAMLALYMELTPSQQFCFLGTLNAFYAMNIPPLAFDNSGAYSEFVCIFVDMVNETYTSLFNSQAGKDAYISLILATELYAQRFTNSDWLLGYETEDGEKVEGFNDKMNKIAEALKTMSAEDLTLFNADFGTIYADYRKIFDAYNPTDDGEGGEGTDTEIDLGEWKDEFNALKSVVGHLEAAYTAVNQGVNIYNVFFSTFERAQKLYNHILNNAPENIKYILIHEGLYEATITNEDSSTETIFWSYDYVMSVYRAMYVNALVSLGSYDIYKEYEMAALMDMTYELYWINDMSKTIDAMEYFCNMDIEAQIIFILYFNMDESFSYYAAIESSLKDAGYSENVQNAVIKLLDVEMSAIIYNFYTSIIADSDEEMTDEVEAELAVALDELNTAYAAFTDAYGALTTEELAEFEDFDYVYNFYKTLVEKVNSDNTVNP